MYAAYGSTAQSNMFPIAFAIIFASKDKEGWTKFWNYALSLHPSINAPTMTIITDQDKGSEAAVKACIPLAFHFHCAWHNPQATGQKINQLLFNASIWPLWAELNGSKYIP